MGMYELRVKASFDAAHYLWNYSGKCGRVHGHTWKVELAVAGNELDETGMLADFLDLKGILREVIDRFDHVLLNDVAPFCGCEGMMMNPTAENLARVIFEEAREKVQERFPALKVVSVQVWESAGSSVIYR